MQIEKSAAATTRACRWLAIAAGLCLSSTALAAPSIGTIQLSRSSGVAPLAVHFDATGTTDPSFDREFHTLKYEWDFADPNSGTWPISGKSRNYALGGVAGHLFTSGGTYVVRLTVTNPAGQSATATATVVVTDTDSHAWAGSYCYANGAAPDWTGCPAGATRVPNMTSVNSSLSTRFATNTRHLFKRGDSFSLSPFAGTAEGPILIGSFGPTSRPRPVLNATPPADSRLFEVRSDWRIVGLAIRATGGLGAAVSRPMNSTYLVRNTTAYDLDISGVERCTEFNNIGSTSPGFHSGLAFVDFKCAASGAAHRIVFDRGSKSMYLGIDLDGSAGNNSPFRSVYMNRSMVQHSRIIASQAGGIFAIRSCGQDNGNGCANNGNTPNQYDIFSDNRFVDRNDTRSIRTCMHDECDTEGNNGNQAADMIWERNFFAYDYTAAGETQLNSVFWLEGANMTVRNNIFDLTGIPVRFNTSLVSVSSQGPTNGGQLSRSNISVLNNTVFWSGSAHEIILCDNTASGTGHSCRNNLVYAPSAQAKVVTQGSGWTASNNMRDATEYSGFPFAVSYRGRGLSQPGDFMLTTAAPVIDRGFGFGGVSTEFVWVDFDQRCRAGTNWDVGAQERDGAPCPTGGGGGGGGTPAALAPPVLLSPL